MYIELVRKQMFPAKEKVWIEELRVSKKRHKTFTGVNNH